MDWIWACLGGGGTQAWGSMGNRTGTNRDWLGSVVTGHGKEGGRAGGQ